MSALTSSVRVAVSVGVVGQVPDSLIVQLCKREDSIITTITVHGPNMI